MNFTDDVMPSTYFRLILREWGTSNLADGELCVANGEDVGGVITVKRQLAQFEALQEKLQPGWGFQLGAVFEPPAHGPVGVAVVSAPNLRASLDVINSFGHHRTPFFQYDVKTEGRYVRIIFRNKAGLSEDLKVSLFEASFVGIFGLLRPILGERTKSVAFEGSIARPDYVHVYCEYLKGDIDFGTRETGIRLQRKWLKVPSPLYDPDLYESSLKRLRTITEGLKTGEPIVNLASQMIADASQKIDHVVELASAINMSKRTLVRRLSEAGTSFSELKDSHRKARAHAMLRGENHDLQYISHQLGYSDFANFGRACRRWFGVSPGSYRKQLQKN